MRIILIFCFMAVMSIGLKAQNSIILHMNDYSKVTIDISKISKIAFSNDLFQLKNSDGTKQEYTLSNINKLTFGATSELESVPDLTNKQIIYPNPASNFIILKNHTGDADVVKIFTLEGREVLAASITGEDQIDISSLAKGFYVMMVNNNAFKFTKR